VIHRPPASASWQAVAFGAMSRETDG